MIKVATRADAGFGEQARSLAARIGDSPANIQIAVGKEADVDYFLEITSQGVQLRSAHETGMHPLRVDFAEGAANHRRLYGGGKGQMIAKAVGIQGKRRPSVVDATAGLGQDAFVLATLGCNVTLIERNVVVHALLQDGLQRAALSTEVADIVALMQLADGNALRVLSQLPSPDVIYLDPMFPERQKSALVKKAMRFFHDVVGDDEDAANLLPLARQHAKHRVVVKRPLHAPFLADAAPTYQLKGKAMRYDIFVNAAFGD